MVIHVVKSGETLSSIAAEYGEDPKTIALQNDIADDAVLVVGQTIVIQFPDIVHVVRRGDTLTSIASLYGVTVNAIYRNNRWLMGQPAVEEGAQLVITYFRQPLGTAAVNGYAYPYIDKLLLSGELPYLTYMTPFTYGISESGHLVPLEDGEMIALALNYSTTPLMHLSTLTEDGGFSSERAVMLLNDKAMQDALIVEILQNIRTKGYGGLDIDFEYIPGTEAGKYADFVAAARSALNAVGYIVIVALAPKTSADQKGLLYEGHDYAMLGSAANAVFLMTYEWGYTYGEPMAVAPLPNVRAVLDYAVTEIPAPKILLGVPLYGYDWKLPYVQGVTRAQSLSPVRAVEIAAAYGAQIAFDDASVSPYFYYTDEYGNDHVVWFEDARSIEAKLKLIAAYGIRGVGYWNLDRPFPQNWLVLNDMYDIEKQTE